LAADPGGRGGAGGSSDVVSLGSFLSAVITLDAPHLLHFALRPMYASGAFCEWEHSEQAKCAMRSTWVLREENNEACSCQRNKC
jgi:hypothetical protein